jgi:hypothetical protein
MESAQGARPTAEPGTRGTTGESADWLARIAASPWFAYGSILAIQAKVLWGIWNYRDLTPGDGAYYFAMGSHWADHLQVTPAYYPLYNIFWGSLQWIVHDAYAVTLVHRVLIVLATTALLLAVLRRLLTPGIAWALSLWWAALPITYDTIFEIHLFGALAGLAIALVALRWSGLAARATVFGLLLAAALLVRNEYIVAALAFAIVWAGYELWRVRRGVAPPWRRLAAAGAIPLVAFAVLFGLVSWRDWVHGSVVSQLTSKNELAFCQGYALGLDHSGDVRTANPLAQCTVYTREDFGEEMPSLFQAVADNPGAVAGHFGRNAALFPAGLELGLFNEKFGSVGPASKPVRASQILIARSWGEALAVGHVRHDKDALPLHPSPDEFGLHRLAQRDDGIRCRGACRLGRAAQVVDLRIRATRPSRPAHLGEAPDVVDEWNAGRRADRQRNPAVEVRGSRDGRAGTVAANQVEHAFRVLLHPHVEGHPAVLAQAGDVEPVVDGPVDTFHRRPVTGPAACREAQAGGAHRLEATVAERREQVPRTVGVAGGRLRKRDLEQAQHAGSGVLPLDRRLLERRRPLRIELAQQSRQTALLILGSGPARKLECAGGLAGLLERESGGPLCGGAVGCLLGRPLRELAGCAKVTESGVDTCGLGARVGRPRISIGERVRDSRRALPLAQAGELDARLSDHSGVAVGIRGDGVEAGKGTLCVARLAQRLRRVELIRRVASAASGRTRQRIDRRGQAAARPQAPPSHIRDQRGGPANGAAPHRLPELGEPSVQPPSDARALDRQLRIDIGKPLIDGEQDRDGVVSAAVPGEGSDHRRQVRKPELRPELAGLGGIPGENRPAPSPRRRAPHRSGVSSARRVSGERVTDQCGAVHPRGSAGRVGHF